MAKRITELRVEESLSQSQLGRAIDVSQSAISNWEKGYKEPSIESLRRLASFFQVSVDYLIGVKDDY